MKKAEKRLIDANAFEFEPDENGIANGLLIWGGRSGGKTMTTVLSALKKMIDNAPTVDAVEVVRCRNCKHRHTRPNCGGRPMDFFCADGERIGRR